MIDGQLMDEIIEAAAQGKTSLHDGITRKKQCRRDRAAAAPASEGGLPTDTTGSEAPCPANLSRCAL